MVIDATPNLMPAEVKTPMPSRLILMATALAPKSMHINIVKEAAKKEKSLFCGAASIIDLLLFSSFHPDAAQLPESLPAAKEMQMRGTDPPRREQRRSF